MWATAAGRYKAGRTAGRQDGDRLAVSRQSFTPSPERLVIIDHHEGHLQVIACAGSGKTESIAPRIARLIAVHDVEPASIIWRMIADFIRQAEVIEHELLPADRLEDPLRSCYEAYLAMLERYRVFSFGRIIGRAVELLGDRGIHRRVHGRLRHLVIDEYQDINPAQERLIRLLAKPPVTLGVVRRR